MLLQSYILLNMPKKYTEPTFHFDFLNDKIQNILASLKGKETLTDKEFAIKAYLYVRDTWSYNPYRFSLINEDWKVSEIITHKNGHCLDKAIILISILRAAKIPARLGLAKVRNHIAIDDIIEKFGSDVLVPHGYVEIFLNDKWVKATPAFNKELCELLNVKTLEFDGEQDSLFQEFDQTGEHVFMEYLEDYGTFNEVPLPFMHQLMTEHYPPFQKQHIQLGCVLNLKDL
jgi:transglutaminase-like putative cysteine protease